MSGDKFVVSASLQGHSVNLYRKGRHCVTFANGLSKENAEREARNLAALWRKISSDHDFDRICSGANLIASI